MIDTFELTEEELLIEKNHIRIRNMNDLKRLIRNMEIHDVVSILHEYYLTEKKFVRLQSLLRKAGRE